MSTSFELISTSPNGFPIPVEKYRSNRTGIKLYVCNINAPVVSGYLSLATEAVDDDGLPHTLEHMVFLGSEDYPYSGIMDLIANTLYANGTNAWTAVDNTTYTVSTVEKDGFLQLLPIYLDHILYPLLNESGYITEVYHVNGDGEDAGVVYSEMQDLEADDDTIVERVMHKHMYPNLNCGYRYDTGGLLYNLRTSLSYKKVIAYHDTFYRPNNMAIIICGKVDSNELIQVIEKFEEKILNKNPEKLKLNEKPFSRPIEPLSNNIEETVYFPCDNEEGRHGIVSIGWRGPHINEMKELFALDILFAYLTESSISPLQAYFVQQNSLCNRIAYKIEEYKETFVMLSFMNAKIDHLNTFKPKFEDIINEILDRKISFDMERLKSIIKMKIAEVKDKFEDEPHSTIANICIGDFLYGDDDQRSFNEKLLQIEIFEKLTDESDLFWIKCIEKWLKNSYSITLTAKPSVELMHKVANEEKQRFEERKTSLGKKGLDDLGSKLQNAIDKNSSEEAPDELFEQLCVPSLDEIKFHDIIQYSTNNTINHTNENSFNMANLNHLQLQIDHLENTDFIRLSLFIDTTQIDTNLRKYLTLYVKLLFESPIRNDEVQLSHDQVVNELNKNLLEYDASIGIDGDEFEFGDYAQYLSIFIKVTFSQLENGIKWLKYAIFDNVIDLEQVKIGIKNLLKEISHRKQNSSDVLDCVTNEITFKKDTNVCLNGFLKQEKVLEKIGDIEKNGNLEIINILNNVKSALLKDSQLRFYICCDINKIRNENYKFDEIMSKYFPSTLINCNKLFNVIQPFKFKYEANENPFQGQDYIIGLGSTESTFIRIITPIEIDSYEHKDYASVLVLQQYFTQFEGPLYEAVRGPGYGYNIDLQVDPEIGLLTFGLNQCSNVTKAYETARNLFKSYVNNADEFDENLLETAKNSLIFTLIDSLKSVSGISEYSMMCKFKNLDLNSIKKLFKNIENVNVDDFEPLLSKYMMPLFDEVNSNCVIICNPSKLDTIIDDFNKKFDRKLINIGKLDDSFCAK